jgi:Spy/CpxP family protein refolding chaperone
MVLRLNMKKVNAVVLFLLFSMVSFAQKPDRNYDKDKLESARVAYITNRIDLKPEQAEKFWPLYNQYQEERSKMMDEISSLNQKGNTSISDAEAKNVVNNRLEKQQQMLDMEKKFMKDAQEVISPSQAVKLHGINRQFTRHLYRMNQGRNRGGGKNTNQ